MSFALPIVGQFRQDAISHQAMYPGEIVSVVERTS